MKKSVVFSVFLFFAPAFIGTTSASDEVIVNPNAAVEFAVLPPEARFPEGIAANPNNGDIVVGTFDFGPNDNFLLRYDSAGTLAGQVNVGGTPLLGLAYNAEDDKVYIANFGASAIQRIAADFGLTATLADIETVAMIPTIGAPRPKRVVDNPDGSVDKVKFGNNFPAPNALVFNSDGDIFVSDSFQGAVYRVNDAEECPPCTVEVIAHDLLLPTAGFPPFGANGLVLSSDESTLYVANTGDDRLLTLEISSGNVGVFTESINGADGVTRNSVGNLVVAANQEDNVLILDGSTGRIKAKLGAFLRITGGKVDGLLFPASVVVVGSNIFVTNLALPLRGTPDEPEGSTALTTYTVSKIPIPGGL